MVLPIAHPIKYIRTMDTHALLEHISHTARELIVNSAPRIALTLLGILIAHVIFTRGLRYSKILLGKKIFQPHDTISSSETHKRLDTLFGIVGRTGVMVIWALGLVMMLSALGVDIGPIVTTAGVLGLAVSFGAQNLVRDFISGFFMLLEDQIRVGDIVTINGVNGTVEGINLRTTILRDYAGAVHVFTNGTILSTANQTKEWSAAVFDVGVAYQSDVDRVIDIMKAVGRQLRADPVLGKWLIADLEVSGLEQFGEIALIIRARQKTLPNRQGEVGVEFRKNLKLALDQAQIKTPIRPVAA